jgi:2-amino-4-hydroxy-6-hydroxymethyldihydropteridine diphosphokinase
MPLATLALGANLPSPAGSPEATLAAACRRLAGLGRIAARSGLYATAPVGFAEQPRFLNAVVRLETNLCPRKLLEALHRIEQEFVRDRSAGIKDGPRTLDLDIILYGDLVMSEAGLEIPHPRFAGRAFVLVPLNEIAPEQCDPRTGRSVAQLLQALLAGGESAAQAVVRFDSALWAAGENRV